MTIIDAAADLLLGSRCPGCDRAGRGVCPACRSELNAGHVRFVRRDPAPPHLPHTVAAGDYVGVLPRLLTGYKDEALLGLTRVLADRLVYAVACLLTTLGQPGARYHLVPIPSTRAAMRQRGLDHTGALARRVAKDLGRRCGLRLPVCAVLQLTPAVVDQVGLDAAGRWRNKLDQVVVRRPGPPGSAPILLDDLTTTGASLAAAAHALGRTGPPVLGAVVVAATVRRAAVSPRLLGG